ncbi:hypothetical protein PG989_004230 [Apiospora arundinis]
MTSSFNLLRLATALLALAPLASASPMGNPAGEVLEVLEARKIDDWEGCSKSNKEKLEKDFKDVIQLAEYAHKGIKKGDKAWTHYFRDGNEDEDHVKNLWDAVAKVNKDDFAFSVRCAPKDDKECQSRTTWSYAVTDARPEDKGTSRQMKICPKYFTDAATKQSMDAKKYDPGNRRGWCKLAPYKFKDFSVGALVLMHEMTHLDVVGKEAKLPEKKDPSGAFSAHGTFDTENAPLDNPPKQARELLNIWKKGNVPSGTFEPWQNAESVADAALEFWVMDKCKYEDMDV